MKKKTWLIIAFLLVALAQLYVPAQMILTREETLDTGQTFKFRTAPIDPNDPFRGKYIMLNFEQNTVKVKNAQAWKKGQEIFVLLQTDAKGFARVAGVSNRKPPSGNDYLKANVAYVNAEPEEKKLTIRYPFDRFYMEESLAPEAERTYVETQQDTAQIAYAQVKIKDGEAVLQDVFINDVSISDFIKTRNQGKQGSNK